MVCGQLRVQSIPTVYAFWQGQPVDGFKGLCRRAMFSGLSKKSRALQAMVVWARRWKLLKKCSPKGAVADAAQTFAAILGEEPENAAAMEYGLARAHIALGDLDTAEALLNNAAPRLHCAQD